MGTAENPGIVPRVCKELFSKIEQQKGGDDGVEFNVEASMLEIYNEDVHDLFSPPSSKQSLSLRVREHPQTGPYVEGLSTCIVKDYGEISAHMEEGAKLRTIAKTVCLLSNWCVVVFPF